MKVRCEYCGNFVEDTQAVCPSCGAPNASHQRTASDTPKTIAELASWYTAHKLPPAQVTRFFIGTDCKEPKAFGIFQDGNEFVVYKNKADGTRAIRYRGTDQAYAVNELYLKLKEEVLRQKNHNLNTRAGTTKRNTSKSKDTDARQGCLLVILFVVVLPALFSVVTNHLSPLLLKPRDNAYYYNESVDQLTFCCGKDQGIGQYEWWRYDFENRNWTQQSYKKFPEKISEKYRTTYTALLDKVENFSDIDIYHNRSFIDAGHHFPPTGNSYYVYDGKAYYYLDDCHSSYGSNDHSGWYIYEDDDWSYYCDGDDREALGSDLWYDANGFAVGKYYSDIYMLLPQESDGWVSDFAETDDYAGYTENEYAYLDYVTAHKHDHSYDYDDDDDYSWDSDDSWDSDGGDWDSDW